MVRFLFLLLVVAGLGAGAAYYIAGRAEGPIVEVVRPDKAVGRETGLELTVEAPGGELTTLTAYVEQNGRTISLFSLDEPAAAQIEQESPERVRVTRPFGKVSDPELEPGPAKLVVVAARPVLYGVRQAESRVERDLQLRFDPPRVGVVSLHHFVNHGGAEMVLYRATPSDVTSGVQVGELRYPGYPASGIGVTGADPSLHVAFFALLPEQDLATPIELFAEDEAGNRTRAPFDHRVFPKQFRRSRIEIDDRFMQRVVPAIVEQSPELDAVNTSGDDLLEAFLQVNGELRRLNADKIAAFARETAPQALWEGAFVQLSNSQVESAFADHRTYIYQGEEVDQQVHLGFDLAVTANVPIRAANSGKVLHADYLGIYGNTVILDHGLGVQSLYAHLSSFDVGVGDTVKKGQVIGRSGMTGLAGGDHLHFTMLLQGHAVTPVEWWDPHWMEDRILRKVREASSSAATSTQTSAPAAAASELAAAR